MNIQENAPASDNGENLADIDNLINSPEPQEVHKEKSVPYSRFQQVNEQKKQAEKAVETVITVMLQDVPEIYKTLVPASLPALERLEWLQHAKATGLFTQQVPSNSPDHKRPVGKINQDPSTLTPYQKMTMGYK